MSFDDVKLHSSMTLFKIVEEQYNIDSDNNPKLIKTIPISLINLQNGPFNITDDLTGNIEIVPYKTKYIPMGL